MTINITKLNQELSSLRVDKEEYAKKISAFDAEKAVFQTRITELEAKLVEMETKQVEAKKEEVAVVIAVEESVNKKVVQTLAAVGIPEGAVKEDVSAVPVITDSMEIYKRFDALKGKEKIEFFQKNEGIILGAMKQIHYSPITTQPKKI